MYAAAESDAAVRRAFLHRCPYALIYEIEPNGDIVVLACLHVRQEPRAWAPRP